MAIEESGKRVLDFGVRRLCPLSPRAGELAAQGAGARPSTAWREVSTSLFQQVDDALFDYADRAGASGAQQQFFDGMREIRRKRQRVEEKFRTHVDIAFQDYSAGRKLAATDATGRSSPRASRSSRWSRKPSSRKTSR